jgi:hypothetical protein
VPDFCYLGMTRASLVACWTTTSSNLGCTLTLLYAMAHFLIIEMAHHLYIYIYIRAKLTSINGLF